MSPSRPIPDLRTLLVACVASAAGAVALPAAAQDAAVVNPHTVKVVLDDAAVRVLEATLPPGAREQPHSHPSSVIYVIEGGKVRNHLGDGTVVETELTPGQTTHRGPTTHWAENIGTTTIRLVLVELKEPPPPVH